MGKLRWIVAGMVCLLTATPSTLHAQQRAEAEDFVRDVLLAIFGPNWNVDLHGGATTSGRYLLQSVVGGQRALKTGTGFNFGVGAGVDILLRTGFRLDYTFSSSNLQFRTDNGTGSEALDLDDLGKLKSNVVAIEVMRYMLPARARITPFAAVGLAGSWWSLDEESALIIAPEGSTQFRMGGRASFGLQGRLSDHLTLRAESTINSLRSPFTGKESFVVTTGTTIDEPTSVRRTDFKLALMYYFERPTLP